MMGYVDAVLVLCPSSIKMVWGNELDKHCPLAPERHVIRSGKYKQVEEFTTDRGHFFPWLIAGIEGLSQGKAYEYVMQFARMRRVAVILDESSKIKTHNATRTKRAIKIARECNRRVILSGTAITQGLEDLYSQFQFLNPDILGHTSYYSYRNTYCITQSIEVAHDKWVQKIVGYQNQGQLTKLIKPYTMRVDKKDALDLPEKVMQYRQVPMNPAQAKLYKQMKEEFIAYLNGSEYEATTVLEQMLRLQQITGGHYPGEEGETSPIPGVNPKLKELQELELRGKVVIWCQFRDHVADVVSVLPDCVEFHGGCSDDEKEEAVEKFQNGDAKYFVATRAAAYGLTLTSASTAVYYSQGYSLEDYSQSQDRIHRIGQEETCVYIHLVGEGTIDVDIIKALEKKQSLADMVYGMVKQ
jgi:SNF2 family DNA or RNA helicase